MSRKIDTDSWEYKFMLIKKTRPNYFSKKMRMNWGIRRRMVDYLYAFHMHYISLVEYTDKMKALVSTFGGCTPCEVCGEADRADTMARVALGRLNGLVEGIRLSGIEVAMEVDTVVSGLPLLKITVQGEKS
jgi:hypothetical protein